MLGVCIKIIWMEIGLHCSACSDVHKMIIIIKWILSSPGVSGGNWGKFKHSIKIGQKAEVGI